jgi:hypothetical protein
VTTTANLLANTMGFQKPGPVSAARTSLFWASSPTSEQGGNPGLLIRGFLLLWKGDFPARESAASVVGLSTFVSDPTTTASAAESSLSLGLPAVPSANASADAVPELGPSAPAWSTASRWWSAHADDEAREAFPLDLLPLRAMESPPRRLIDSHGHLAHLSAAWPFTGLTPARRREP